MSSSWSVSVTVVLRIITDLGTILFVLASLCLLDACKMRFAVLDVRTLLQIPHR